MKTFVLSVLGVASIVAIVVSGMSAPPSLAAATCSDSWNSDGHIGPWYTSSNSTLHGNSLHIACPSSGTAWSVTYMVERESNGTLVIPIQQTRTGTGTTSFSISVSPVACAKAWDYWTYAHNNKTGGNISKPSDHLNVICV